MQANTDYKNTGAVTERFWLERDFMGYILIELIRDNIYSCLLNCTCIAGLSHIVPSNFNTVCVFPSEFLSGHILLPKATSPPKYTTLLTIHYS